MNSAQRLVFLLLAISLLVGITTGQQLYYRLSYIWALLLGVSWLMSVLSLRGIVFIRSARTLRSQVGQIYEERFEIRNMSRWPRLWIEVRDESELPGSSGSHVLTLIGGRESRSYLARTRLNRRGVFPLGPTVLQSGDLFGLFPISRRFPSEDSLLVYPMMVDVPNFPSPAGLLPGGEALRRRTSQITSNAAGVREYEPGDPLNRIHWLSTARRNRMMVKEFELDPLAEVWLFVDSNRSVHASKPYQVEEFDPQEIWRRKKPFDLPPASIEYTVTAAASLARYYLQNGRAVGFVSAGQVLRVLPSDRGGRQLGKILEGLALLQADGSLPLQGLIDAQARHLPRGSTVVLITPSASDAVVQGADLLLRRGLRPIVVAIDAASFGGYFKSDALVSAMRVINVPVCSVSEGDDLAEVLSASVSTRSLV
jgi:uncharacterized protein (DUF58 family)